jgi:glycosyltransferase involved in cell wall biosynthesis
VDVTVCIGTFGDPSWADLAQNRAVPSAQAPVQHVHSDSLHDARNAAASLADTEFLCFLDADDELEPGYFDAMRTGTADVRAPAVRYVRSHNRQPPYVPKVAGHTHLCDADCLTWGNWLVIGSLVRTELFWQAGGFRAFDWSEDWDLWVRCREVGATFEAIPRAVYRAHVRSDSRNRAPARETKLAAHRAIAEANGLPVPA